MTEIDVSLYVPAVTISIISHKSFWPNYLYQYYISPRITVHCYRQELFSSELCDAVERVMHH